MYNVSWPYTKKHCCRQLLQATMLLAIRPSVYSRATVADNTQLHNYLSLLSATVPSNKVTLCMVTL